MYWSESRQRWVARLELGPGPDGRRERPTRFRRTRKAAVQALHQMRRDYAAGAPEAHRETVAGYLTSWLDSLDGARAPKTIAAYRSDVAHVVAHLGPKKLAAVTPHDVRTMLAALDLAPKTRLNVRTTLHTAMSHAVKDRLLDWNPVSVVARPRVPRYDARPLTVVEARQVLAALDGDRLEALWTVAVAVGLRLGEALGLTWGRIDLDAGLIRVRHQLRLEGPARQRHYVLADLKNPKRVRDVPLPAFAAAALETHRKRQAAERLAAGSWTDGCCDDCGMTGVGLVFATNSRRSAGRPLHDTVARNAFRAICETTIGRTPRVHDLRHTAATLLIAQGVPLPVVQDVLGHSSIQVTKDLYGHLDVDALRGAAGAMDDVLG